MVQPKEYIKDEIRWAVFRRDNLTCRYCGDQNGPFHIDHVYPESKGGATVIGNLVTSCERCNHKKKDKIGVWPLPIPEETEEEEIKIAEPGYLHYQLIIIPWFMVLILNLITFYLFVNDSTLLNGLNLWVVQIIFFISTIFFLRSLTELKETKKISLNGIDNETE